MKHGQLFLALFAVVTILASASGSSAFSTASANAGNRNINVPVMPSGPSSSGGGEDQTKTAEMLVAELYKAANAKRSPFFQTKDRSLVDKYFTKPLADLIWKDATSSKGEVGAIDGDPLYNAQDTEIKNFAIGKAEVKNDGAMVRVTFTNFGEKVTILFALKQTAGAWKIDNIIYGNDDSLMKWLRDAYAPAAKKSTSENSQFNIGETAGMVTTVKRRNN